MILVLDFIIFKVRNDRLNNFKLKSRQLFQYRLEIRKAS